MKSVFVASSRKYYDDIKLIKKELDKLGVKGNYPYFHLLDEGMSDEKKIETTLKHFPEIDEIDVLYVYAKQGYVGNSVTVEVTYAYAKGKEIISSELVDELAVRAMISKVMPPKEFTKYVSNQE